jgi:16S rRNA (guanine(966)-N(2))-methyltransferase RsmD
MRVISGSAKGRPLKAPGGMGTRPMTDRVKESLFNILMVLGYPQEGDRVLDLYAGSGALGIEALSRGAGWADFVEQAAEPGRCIRDNLRTTGLDGRGKLHPVTVAAFLRSPPTNLTINGSSAHNRSKYDIIFCDPPYADPGIRDTVAQLAAWPGLSDDALLVVGHAIQVVLPDTLGPLARIRFRTFGGSAFSLYKHAAGPVPADDEALEEED